MEYSLYELYDKSQMTLNEIRNHFLECFYYQDHSRNDARKVLKTVVSSSRIKKLIEESCQKKTVPTYEDYYGAIRGMLRFMFRSDSTQILAAIEAAQRWNIEVNEELKLMSPEELKKEIIKVFEKCRVYKNVSEKKVDRPMSDFSQEEGQNTWTLAAFSQKFGKMEVGEFTNRQTGEIFKSCIFTKGKSRVFVGFSSKLGVLAQEEIEKMKDDLVVIKSKTGKYNLYKRKRDWKKVDLERKKE